MARFWFRSNEPDRKAASCHHLETRRPQKHNTKNEGKSSLDPTPRHNIEQLHFFQGGINMVGWAEECLQQNEPVVLLNKAPLKTISVQVNRPDLVEHYGNAAQKWGFRIIALTGDAVPSLDNMELLIAGTSIKIEPQPDHEDANFGAMFEEFRSSVSQNPTATVLEIGARARSGNIYRHLFPDTIRYIGFDVVQGYNVDIVGDAHHLSRFIKQQVDFVLSFSTFEHLLMPWKVVLEINKVLTPGGLVFTQAPQTWPIHDMPWDYWRFSRDCWIGLFNPYTGFELVGTAYSHRAVISPANFINSATWPLPQHPAYLLTACVARKIGEPSVSWDVEASEIIDLAYSW